MSINFETYVLETYINKIMFEENGVKKVLKSDLDKLLLTPQERNFTMYILNKLKIKTVASKITKNDRSPYVRDNNYGDISSNELEKIDEPVMSTINYSETTEKIHEDYTKLDEYLENRFIPTYVLMKKRKNASGKIEYYQSIRLYHITALRLSEAELKHVMEYLNSKNIRVGGRGSTFDSEFENYDFVSTYKSSELPKTVPPEVTLQKIAKYQETKDPELKEEIIHDNMRLVPYVAYRYAFPTKINQHELESYGYEGLIIAIDNFNLDEGCNFSSYAIATIRGYILKGIQEIKEGKITKFYYSYVNAKNAVERETGLSVEESPELIDDIVELLVATGNVRDEEDARLVAKSKVIALTIGNTNFDEEELEIQDELLDEVDYEEIALDNVFKEQLNERLNDVLDTLTKREEEIIRLRFGLYPDGKPHTLEAIGKKYNVTRDRIRQIEKEVLRKLRHPSRGKYLKSFLSPESEPFIRK